MNVYYEEKFLERRERKRNERISKALIGRMKPPNVAIIQKLKEKSTYTYEQSGKIERTQ